MDLPSSEEPVWPRMKISSALVTTMAPCQAMVWPNQSRMSKVRWRRTGAAAAPAPGATASASIWTISSGSARPATTSPVLTG